VRIREERIVRLEGKRRQLRQIVFASGPPEQRDALFLHPTRSQPSLLAERIGLEVDDNGMISADEAGRTDVPNVFVAGDAAEKVRSVAISIGRGSRVGTAMAAELILDRFAPAPAVSAA
jgi:thioredoxin reductase